MDRIAVKFGKSSRSDPKAAVAELADQVVQPGMKVLLFFCSNRYEPGPLAEGIRSRFGCPALGCTTAGEILSGDGYLDGTIVGASIASSELTVTPCLIESLTSFVRGDERGALSRLDPAAGSGSFALLLVDGLSMLEERVAAVIQNRFHGVPLVGGSAGDALDFRHTRIYHDGRFHENAAMLALFKTTLPFKPFRIQHFEPTNIKLVITEADCPARKVNEINGDNAAVEYARAVGRELADLTPDVFAAHPLMLRIGGEYYARSIQRVNNDGSLTFYCAIDNGLVLTVGKPKNLIEGLRTQMSSIREEVGDPKLIIGCDCILRRLEMRGRGELGLAGEVLAPYPFIGFSTYGEQMNGLHINHTLTGIALGG